MKSLIEKLVKKQEKSPVSPHLAWLSNLNGLDDLTVLEKTIQYLSNISTDSSVSEIERFELLLSLDEGNRERIEKISALYAKYEKLQPKLELRIAEISYYYQRQLYLSYQQHIDSLLAQQEKNQPNWLDPRHNKLQLIIGRAMYAAFAMIKLRYFNNQTMPDSSWLQIFNLYKIAEHKSLLTSPIQLYSDKKEGTLNNVFARACMLDSLDHTIMSRQHIDVANKLLNRLWHKIKISPIYDEKKHLYFIDLNTDHGAKRIRNLDTTPAYRYWDMDEFCIQIELILYSINNKKPLAPNFLGSLAGHPALLDVVTQMHTEWSQTNYHRQRRKEARRQVEESAIVAYGVQALCDQIKYIKNRTLSQGGQLSYSSKSFEERLATNSISKLSTTTLMPGQWTITDESTQGYGALVSKDASQIAKPDKLVGMVFKDSQNIVIGVIKDVTELSNGENHIGIQILSRNAVWIQVVRMDGDTNSDTTSPNNLLGFSGLYLPSEENLCDTASFILPRLNFKMNSTYQISTMNKISTIKIGSSYEAKDDWVRVMLKS